MKLMIVGGGEAQLNTVRRAKSLGLTVVVSDKNPNCPCAAQADIFVKASTFNSDKTYEAAMTQNINAIMTMGTDQPVLSVALTALKMGIPSGISSKTALAVTNKRVMKPIFVKNGISNCKFAFISENSGADTLSGLTYPLVIKPVDSQGQRGVYKVNNWKELKGYLPDVLSYSREKEALVEEFYESEEITVSGWSAGGKFYPLTITDRVTISNGPHIGVCTSHEYPSKYLEEYGKKIIVISEKIVSSFSITNGPVYIQMLIGKDGIKVNEVASRIGGAYEDEFIPAVTRVDILKLQFDLALTGRVEKSVLKNYDFPSPLYGSVILFFTNPGIVKSNGDMDLIKKIPGVINGKYILKPGRQIGNRENSTARAGYVALQSDSRESLEKLKKKVYSLLKVEDTNGDNMICEY